MISSDVAGVLLKQNQARVSLILHHTMDVADAQIRSPGQFCTMRPAAKTGERPRPDSGKVLKSGSSASSRRSADQAELLLPRHGHEAHVAEEHRRSNLTITGLETRTLHQYQFLVQPWPRPPTKLQSEECFRYSRDNEGVDGTLIEM